MRNHSSSRQNYLKEHLGKIIFLVVLGVLTTAFLKIPLLQEWTNQPIENGVLFLSSQYSKLSTLLYEQTGIDIGFVMTHLDPDFVVDARMASAINQRQAEILLAMAADDHYSTKQRKRALLGLLKFDSINQWIQPFLNDLPKGGLVGLYEDSSPEIDQLVQRIHDEGGIKQPFVRAYAEVACTFLLQVKAPTVRIKAADWVMKVLPNESAVILAERTFKEKDAKVQTAIEDAFWRVEAVSDSVETKLALVRVYQQLPWKTLRGPIAVILARLKFGTMSRDLPIIFNKVILTADQQDKFEKGLRRLPYPSTVEENPTLRQEREARQKWQSKQYAYLEKRREKMEQERRVLENLKKRLAAEKEQAVPVKEMVVVEKPETAEKIEQPVMEKKVEMEKPPVKSPLTSVPVKEVQAPTNPVQAVESKQVPQQVAMKPEVVSPVQEKVVPAAPSKVIKQPAVVPTPTPPVAQEKVEKAAAPISKEVPAPTPVIQKKNLVPVSAEIPKTNQPSEEEMGNVVAKEAAPLTLKTEQKVEVASLPEGPVEPPPPPMKALKGEKPTITPVDLIYHANDDLLVYKDPKEEPPSLGVLRGGSEGKAISKAVVRNKEWFLLDINGFKGWVRAEELTLFEAPTENVFALPPPPPPAKTEPQEQGLDATYFEPLEDGIKIYKETDIQSRNLGVLKEGQSYLAVDSKKVGPDRWFKLEISKKNFAWAQGFELKLGEKPSSVGSPIQDLVELEHAGASVKPQWVIATTDNVTVYKAPAVASPEVGAISPPTIFPILELKGKSGAEWYRIRFNEQNEGWVQGGKLKLRDKPPKENEKLKISAPPNPTQTEKKSEYVAANAKSVTIYSSPSIIASEVGEISPPVIYPIVAEKIRGNSKWYKVVIGEKKEGWVQSIDVSIVQPN